ncbi:MAG: coenzyme F420-0:L-glutamate ligase, partial [Nitrosopumilaceae archaeon]
MSLAVSALLSERKNGIFDVFEAFLETLNNNHENIQDGDVVVISTKYISNSQGRIVNVDDIIPSKKGNE